MKTLVNNILFIICILILMISTSCTKGPLPTLNDTYFYTWGSSTVTVEGLVSNIGGSDLISYGTCWNTTPNPTVSLNSKISFTAGLGNYKCFVSGLTPNTTYYFRNYASNNAGTTYAKENSITTLGTFNDFDGNKYNTIKIGNAVWSVENLKVTHYQNGDAIPTVLDNPTWISLTNGALCWYNNNSTTYKDTYGALYNWYATIDNRKLCPTGWHVATDNEWGQLGADLGGAFSSGGELKEAGNSHWNPENPHGTNESGFTGLPGGYRDYFGEFLQVSKEGHWWSSTQYNSTGAWGYSLNLLFSLSRESYAKKLGQSVRCLKD